MGASNWNLSAPPGFQGLHPDRPVTVYQRHLPHWRQDGATYFVTSRLADSLPQSKLQELDMMRQEWRARQAKARATVGRIGNPSYSQEEELARLMTQRVEDWLDQGMGSCWLKRPDVSQHVISALAYFDGSRYELGAYVVMPNHIHVILRPLQPATDPLERILQSRKRQTARDINKTLGRQGTVWQEESFDRIIRDEEHLYRCIQYIGGNPRRAGLSTETCPRWLQPSWVQLGWRFEGG